VLDIDTVLELHKNIVLRGIGDKYWALDVSTGDQYKLNEVSFFILDLFRNPQTIAQITKAVMNEYNVTRERVIEDCRKVLQFADEKKIIKEVCV
jgi:hypothetical protein